MKIILSPAKKMNTDLDTLDYIDLPEHLSQTKEILHWLQSKSYGELKTLWCCNDQIAELNFRRLSNMDLHNQLTPAILSYEGIAFQYMAPAVFEYSQFDYVQQHLRILSAFYGVLKPMDGVIPYRLEMNAKASINGCKNLYDLWGRKIYDSVRDEDGIIINLASKEYSRCVEKYLTPEDTYITVTFCEVSGNKLVTKGTYAKMARGEMVRYMAERQIEEPTEIKTFNRLGYVYRDELSTDLEYVFERVSKEVFPR
ncbi:MAG: peroxide stress protein YaaA [Lachnospiraceae bacterium]|nr:peroxide stress protein YaaA [Lachnospiraceae bacterium]